MLAGSAAGSSGVESCACRGTGRAVIAGPALHGRYMARAARLTAILLRQAQQ
jgi:hypothetical protein